MREAGSWPLDFVIHPLIGTSESQIVGVESFANCAIPKNVGGRIKGQLEDMAKNMKVLQEIRKNYLRLAEKDFVLEMDLYKR